MVAVTPAALFQVPPEYSSNSFTFGSLKLKGGCVSPRSSPKYQLIYELKTSRRCCSIGDNTSGAVTIPGEGSENAPNGSNADSTCL